MSVVSGRWIALQALLHLEDPFLSAGAAIDRAWAEAGASESSAEARRERALAMELVLGVLRWELRLDGVITRLQKKGSVRGMHPAVRALLRLGLYQLTFLDRIPERAAVSETVALSRPAQVGFASGFINASLRRFLREKDALLTPSGRGLAALAERWSHPRWLVEAMAPVLGDELEPWLQACQAVPPLTLRVHPPRGELEAARAALEADGWAVAAGALSPTALCLGGRNGVAGGAPSRLPGFAEGRITVQDEGSQLVGWLVEPGVPGDLLDACAAPGGKAAHLASRFPDRTLWAVDGRRERLPLMMASLERLGVEARVRLCDWGVGAVDGEDEEGGWIHPRVVDAPPLASHEARPVAAALVDAPCTGFGVTRRIPEIKRRKGPADVARMAGIQARILDAVAERVVRGGCLVYSVCSCLPEEGPGLVEAFLAEHRDFTIEDPRVAAPALPWADALAPDGSLRTFPHRHGADAFYAVRLRRG